MIRNYTPSDKSAVLTLMRHNMPTYFHADEEPGFSHYLDNEREQYFVIMHDGEIIGCGGLNTDGPGEMCISWDIIHPDYHGQGYGRQLTEYRIHLVRQDPAVRVLHVRTTQLTDRFYAKFGFKLIRTEKDYWAPGLDLYHMELVL